MPEAPAEPGYDAFHIIPPWLEALIQSDTVPTSAPSAQSATTPKPAPAPTPTSLPSDPLAPKPTSSSSSLASALSTIPPPAPKPTSSISSLTSALSTNPPPAPKPTSVDSKPVSVTSTSNLPTKQSTSPPVPPANTPSIPPANSVSSKPSATAFTPATKTCPAGTRNGGEPYWLDAQDHKQGASGYAPYAGGSKIYPVYRNVLDYGVVRDGSGDQTAKLQHAIDDDGNGGTRKGKGVTRYPAEVFLPGGVYTLGSTLTMTVGTIIVGDPLNPPILRASPDFQGQFLIMGYDKNNGNPETSFMMLLKNVILDTNAIGPNTKITALQWGVAQGSGLTNVEVHMPFNSKVHTGIDIVAGSTIAVTDVRIIGGATGIINSNQQVNFKNIQFVGCGTAFEAKGGFTVLLQSAGFESCGTGINMTSNGLGSLVLLDSTSRNSGPVVRFHDSSHDTGYKNSQLLIQNLVHDGTNPIAVDSEGRTRLASTAHVDTWLWGSLVEGEYEQGAMHNTQRSASLLVNDKFFIKAQPTYSQFSSADVVNVKSVPGHPVKGDGLADETASLNAILKQNAENCKITFIPFGVYRVSDTLFVPVGTRIVGEAWAVISGYGDAFKDPRNPRAIVKLGNPGDVGLIEIQDMRFSVGEILPGAKVLEINAAGSQPGDVGLWNTNVMVGGTAETVISNICTSQDPKDCMAAYMVMHLTSSSSAYIENFWGWTADHNLDSTSLLTIVSTGRGILVEATKGTWLTGTGSEHHWLYEYNFNKAANVFAGLLQSESPYMQGSGEYENTPAPWAPDPKIGDPDFTWCGANDQKCRTSIATNIEGGSNIALYNSAAWAFFDGYWNGLYNEPCSGKCQTNMMRVAGAPQNLVWYSIGTRQTDVMILDGKSNPREADHPGGWEGIIQAYGEFSN
ncbi:Pectin lyase fold/virulence factor [Penicillium odoratum]|uniref:Pectin lyase fold/virulence factor n=1 Tax=Penicillium odoratum TaxID=1167516 RepID=UPI00254937C8|nr:Pectin lyase fold/virulence factor [Penicillium odoratum]KAJ5771709.1 Pectin lyase fold/virulence factor [Penicillium odoratum]